MWIRLVRVWLALTIVAATTFLAQAWGQSTPVPAKPAPAKATAAKTPATPASRRAALEQQYQRIKGKYPDTVDGQWQLAEWCRQHSLSTVRQTHLKRILELDPEHLAARRALGYQKHNGEWVTQEQLMTERGYVRSGGKWLLPQEVKQRDAKRKQRASENQWQGNLKKWRSWLDDERADEALANIRAISDPTAIKAVRNALAEDPDQRLRMLYVGALARIATPEAIAGLVRVSLTDVVEEVRLTAIDHLAEKKHPEVIAMYIQALHDKDNTIVNRAAVGLEHMNNPAAIPPLIDALLTTHEYMLVQGQPGISTSFGSVNTGHGHSMPSTGMSTGQSITRVAQTLQNAAVRDALIKLAGVDYEFNIPAWKAWLLSRKKGPSLDARRDS